MSASSAEISWIFAFLAGVVSFLSPCVLPLIPGYISMVSKLSFDELRDEKSEGRVMKILIPSLVFVLGFSLVFITLGVSASFAGGFLARNKILLLKVSGVIIIIFGLFVMELLKIPQLYRERRLNLPETNLGLLGTLFLGIAFGFGWTPCVGPILGSILLYASTAEGAGRGAALLFVYSMGLGLPFLITGLALSRSLRAFGWIKRHYGIYKYAVGGILVAVGGLMVTNNLFYLNIYGQRFLDTLGLDFWKSF
ncbi:MAG: cytochrome c biogenesis CcdA family protein [Deltaproteobacteria bacterium]